MNQPLIHADQIVKTFVIKNRCLTAVRNVSFSIDSGQTLGLVGESGCGKSTLARILLRLYDPTSGSIIFRGQDITRFGPKKMKPVRRRMQMIFQDPFASLNPRMTVKDIVTEPLQVHGIGAREKQNRRLAELLDLVNLPSACGGRFPHEFSGGQRQRIGIARALALNPEFIICDEPISALDVSIQAQIVNLLLELQKNLNLTYLFIAHDLAMVKVMSCRVAVMYSGEFVEIGPAAEIFSHPRHPYTQILLASIPLHDPVRERQRTQIFLQGEPPSPANLPKGCSFCQRCPQAHDCCFQEKPALENVGQEHQAACHDLQKKTRQGASEKIFLAR